MERGPVPCPAEDSIRLPAEPASAAVARDFVRHKLMRTGHSGLEDAALLCVTELVANVTVHTDAVDCLVTVTDAPNEVTIEVSDGAQAMPAIESPSVYSEHGRGLQIVAALAREWGVRASDHCKSVWLRLCDP